MRGYPACSVQDFRMVITFKSALSPWKMLSAFACADSALKRSSAVAASNALLKVAIEVKLARSHLECNSNNKFEQLK
jgi:hypothetical protein